MSIPALSRFLAYPPGFTLMTPILEVTDILSKTHGALCSHIIIVDTDQRPTGALSIKQLWQPDPTVNRQGNLGQLQRWVEPIVQISSQQSLSEIWPLPPADTTPPVVVVDNATRYVGIVNPLAIITWLSGEISLGETTLNLREHRSIATAGDDSHHQSWLLEVSHALKNPMTSLLGLSTLLLDQRVGTLNERQTRYANLIQQVVRKLIAMVNQLLDWMRLDANQLSFDLESISLQPFLHRVISTYLAHLPSSQTPQFWTERFSLDLPSAALAIRGDALRLQQSVHWILDYLLLHQADPAGLAVTPWGSWIGLTLWTQGPPIPSLEALPDWGQPLPMEELATRSGSLDSLGMLLARRFCQMQGGDLTYQVSQAGNRITLLLPPADLEGAAAADVQCLTITVLVLLLCRQSDVIDQVQLQLQGSAYRLALARSWPEAEGMVQRLAPTFVISCPQSFPEAETRLAATAAHAASGGSIPLIIQLATADLAQPPAANQPDSSVTVQTLKQTLDRLSLAPPVGETPSALPGFTILLLPLSASDQGESSQGELTADLRAWLQHYQCRLLQVDDLQQAQVLSRVWQPDAILLYTQQPLPSSYWQHLAQLPELARLPLLTLAPGPNQAQAEDYGLNLYPCPGGLGQPPQRGAISIIQTIAAALGT
jgi:hypothetical protein